MNKLLLIALLFFGYAGYSQNECRTVVDEFTEESNIECFWHKIGKQGGGLATFFHAKITYKDGIFMFVFEPESKDVKNYSIGDELLVKTKNGEIIKLSATTSGTYNSKDGAAFSQGTNTTIWSSIIVAVTTKDHLEYISENGIQMIRFNGDTYKVKKDKKFIAGLNCVLRRSKY